MALAFLIGQSPSPLGQLMTFDMQTFRTGGFRFDNAPEPVADFRFIAPCEIAASDLVVDLRDTVEAPIPIISSAQRMTVAQLSQWHAMPDAGQRAVFACRSGLRAWQAAIHLRSHWGGEISLIAVGDMPQTERQSL